jgi:hypothetical protein
MFWMGRMVFPARAHEAILLWSASVSMSGVVQEASQFPQCPIITANHLTSACVLSSMLPSSATRSPSCAFA